MKLPGAWPPDREAFRRDGLALFAKLIRTKNIEGPPPQQPDQQQHKLTKCLTTLDLTSLGVGSCVGTGMYLVAGMVARNMAGPGVIVSFIIAAVASIFSGACYAEFGVRVPHTSGSAYTYSYVTVGEFIAFVIGWNMVLEYLIGTSACARALSACVDALADGALSRAIKDSMGQLPADGGPPDPLAACITLLMMALLAAGVRKSLLFNNVLNAVNLAAWVFAMAAGLFYVDTANWRDHGGFLPKEWSGVLTGAATCFYAFIGFDIIATTGEEATNPKRSIPLAIVGSLVIVLAAYVTSSALLTLVVPYDKLDEDSALVELFGQVGAYRCKYVVAVGALAGLTVSMFGSMFPMPRILYAMAQDGLIYRALSQIWPSTGTPTIATFGSGLAAALVALLIRLDVLVEMMSIGTLLAYTLVSTCVLILRYQPHSTNLVELLPQSLRTPLRGSPVKETATAAAVNGTTFGAPVDRQLRPDALRQALDSQGLAQQQRVMVRRVTRSSPDSDDTFGGDEPEEEFSMRDDQFLVSDRTENKFYGSLHGAGSATSTGGTAVPGAASLGYLGRRLHAATYLCPAIFPWVDTGPATDESGMYVMKAVGLLYLLIIVFDLTIVFGMYDVGTSVSIFVALLLIAIVVVLLAISRKPQNRSALIFMTPGLPFVPAIAVTVNIYLILKLSILTLIRFTVWMSIGLVVYFHYGIRHSSLEEAAAVENGIELTVTEHESAAAVPAPHSKAPGTQLSSGFHPEWDPNAMWEQNKDPATLQETPQPQQQHQGQEHSQQARPPTRGAPVPNSNQATTLFVSESAFPSWDD